MSSRQPGLGPAAPRTLWVLRGQVVLVHGNRLDVQCVGQCLCQPPWPSHCPFPSTGDSSEPVVGPVELDEPTVVHDAADDRRREPVVGEDGAPPAGLDVRRECRAPPLVTLGYRLV